MKSGLGFPVGAWASLPGRSFSHFRVKLDKKKNLFPVARLIPGGDAIQVTRIQAQRGTDVIYTLIII